MTPEPLLATEAQTKSEGQTEEQSADSSSTESTEQSQETQEASTETKETTEETAAEKPEGAPEAYEFANPDGIPEEVEGDTEIHDAYSEASRELDLTQDQAQTLHDKTTTAIYKRAMDVQAKRTQEWKEAAEKDSEYGGDKFQENLGIAKKAMDEFASDGLRELLNDPNGVGNHPEFIRFMVRVGKGLSEDRFVGSNTGAALDLRDPDVQKRLMYPTSVKQ